MVVGNPATQRRFGEGASGCNGIAESVDCRLVVSLQSFGNATLKKGRRPSFVHAAPPDEAVPLYEYFIEAVRCCGVPTESGQFGAMMDVALVNWGPVTITIER